MTTDDIKAAIAYRHRNPPHYTEWVLLWELAMNTGGAGRRIDAMAFNCFPTEGWKRIAYEIKLTEQDFRSEVADPEKRFLAMLYSTEFYFVAPSGVLNLRYFPADCGLLTLDKPGGRLRIKIDAKKRHPHPVSNSFFASTVRRAYQAGRSFERQEKP